MRWEMRMAMNTSFTKFPDNKATIPDTEAPATFLTAISFDLWMVINDDKQNNPIQATMIESAANRINNFQDLSSDWYCWLNRSSRKKYSKALPGNESW